MQTAVIFDVDGTLADVTSIRHHVLQRRKDFDAFHSLSVNVPPHQHVVDLAHQAKADGHAVIVVTARSTQWRNHTAMWLALNGIPSDAMFMRKQGDHRKDVLVKADILARIRTQYEVVHAVDDNPSIIALWKSEGIPTTRVPGWVEGR